MKYKKFYSAEEAASALSISKQTLLRYEKKGIFPRSRRNPINKWREFLPDDITRLKKILKRET